MQTPETELQKHPQQPTLPLEMFLEWEGTSPGGTPKALTMDLDPSQTCRSSSIWKTLTNTERKRIKSSWTKTMREVADDSVER